MEVICVKPFIAPESIGKPKPELGDKDVVVGERKEYGSVYYLLERFDGIVYNAEHFSPLDSDLDETALVTEEFEEKYCVPVKSKR
jgi:hypothetical protein